MRGNNHQTLSNPPSTTLSWKTPTTLAIDDSADGRKNSAQATGTRSTQNRRRTARSASAVDSCLFSLAECRTADPSAYGYQMYERQTRQFDWPVRVSAISLQSIHHTDMRILGHTWSIFLQGRGAIGAYMRSVNRFSDLADVARDAAFF